MRENGINGSVAQFRALCCLSWHLPLPVPVQVERLFSASSRRSAPIVLQPVLPSEGTIGRHEPLVEVRGA